MSGLFRTRANWPLFALALLLVGGLAFGQAQTTGSVNGRVADEEGKAIANARIELASPALQGTRVATTDETGRFVTALLPVGSYVATISAPGMQSSVVSFRLGIGQVVALDATLRRGEEIREEVTVYGKVSKLETTTLGENFDYEETVEELPIQNRTLEGVATFAPNIQFGPTGGTLAIAGANSFDTVTLLDGAEISDPYFSDGYTVYLEDAIEEVQVLTSGVSARYGRFAGGVVNAITKTGGNTFDGTLRVELDNEDWNSKTPFNEEQEDQVNELFQATLGGYMVKDRLWFFAGGRTRDSDRAYTADFTGDSITNSFTDDRLQLKFRGAINPNHSIEVGYLDKDVESLNRDFFTAEPAAVINTVEPSELMTFGYQGVLTPNLFLDVSATDRGWTSETGGDPTTGRSPLNDLIGGVFMYNNGWFAGAADPDTRDNQTMAANLTQVVSSGDWGAHTLEYGIQYVQSTTEGWNSQSPTGYNLRYFQEVDGIPFITQGPTDLLFNMDFLEALRFAEIPLGEAPKANLDNIAVYIQDSWQVGKWRFDAGLRFEQYDGDGPFVQQTADYDAWAPRAGLTYNIDQNWQLQATYGRYNARMNDGISNWQNGVGTAPRTVDFYVGPQLVGLTRDDIELVLQDDAFWFTLFTSDPRLGNFLLDPNIQSPYAHDFNFTIKRALPRNTGTFLFTYTNRKYKNLFDDFVGGFGQVVTPNGLEDINIFSNSDRAIREYEALTASWDYRPSARWNIGGNWTFSDTRGNYEGEFSNQPAVGSIIGDYEGAYPDEAAIPFGRLDTDIPHRVRAWGTYRFSFKKAGQLALGSVLTYQSGDVWSRAASVDMADLPEYSGDGGDFNSYTHFFFGRNDQRFNSFWRWDASARYQFPIWKQLNGWVKLDVRNVLNNDELLGFSTSSRAVSALTGQPWASVSNPAPGDFPTWAPLGSCGLNDTPSRDCTAFGRITSEGNYQSPRTYLVTVGLTF